MEIEDQCCSLSLAKRLCELGLKQESYFWWVNIRDKENDRDAWFHLDNDDPFDNENHEHYSSFTVAELGIYLPEQTGLPEDNYDYDLEMGITDETYIRDMNNDDELIPDTPRKYWIMYRQRHRSFGKELHYSEDVSEANARAMMVAWLIENGYVKV